MTSNLIRISSFKISIDGGVGKCTQVDKSKLESIFKLLHPLFMHNLSGKNDRLSYQSEILRQDSSVLYRCIFALGTSYILASTKFHHSLQYLYNFQFVLVHAPLHSMQIYVSIVKLHWVSAQFFSPFLFHCRLFILH